MNGETLSFNRDSDQYAWNFYKEFYRGTLLDERYYIGEPCACEYDEKTREYKAGLPCAGTVLVAFVRFEKGDSGKPCDNPGPSNGFHVADCERLRGNCDFNFFKDKQRKLKGIVGGDALYGPDEKTKLLKNIEDMRDQSLEQINVSLMLSTGNLQRVQSEGLLCGEEYVRLDRPDTLVYHLSLFYSDRDAWDEVYGGVGSANADALERYLRSIGDIYCYCNQIYGIGANLADALIESGKRPLNSAKRVEEYIALANDFWKERRESERGKRAIDAMRGSKKLSL